jgi:hypothetical protein
MTTRHTSPDEIAATIVDLLDEHDDALAAALLLDVAKVGPVTALLTMGVLADRLSGRRFLELVEALRQKASL